MEVPANSPLRSAPLIPGTMYKDIDTGMCVGRFDKKTKTLSLPTGNAGVRTPAKDLYYFSLIDHNYATEIAGNTSISLLESSLLFEEYAGEKLRHNLIKAGDGQCGYIDRTPSDVGARPPPESPQQPRAHAIRLPPHRIVNRQPAPPNRNLSLAASAAMNNRSEDPFSPWRPGGGRRRKSRRNKNRNRNRKSRRNRH